MGPEELPPRSRKWRIFAIAITLLIATPLALYVSTLIMQVYSARQASKMLDALEVLRVGDPASSLERTVPACKIDRMASGCEMFPGWGRWQWQLLSRLPFASDIRRVELLRRAGIQPWYLSVSSSVLDGHVSEIRILAVVVGRDKSLGAEWKISESIPSPFHEPNLGPDEKRTSIGGFSITSLPGGCGINIAVTPGSTPRELQARHINRACLLPFSGCDELNKLLPDAISVLDERGQKWADCHGVIQ
ncbi:MAG: hypothetical protein LAO30_25180 [Acidobacteriia bacterium]|nr:hypothetical protein [Terriglobia bacterium]